MTQLCSFYYETENGDKARAYIDVKVDIIEHNPDDGWDMETFEAAVTDEVLRSMEMVGLLNADICGEA